MKFNIVYRNPTYNRIKTTIVPVDIADVSNKEYYFSLAQPAQIDEERYRECPDDPSFAGTLSRANEMFPDADKILFA